MNLYELTGQLMQLQMMLEDETVDPEVLADTLEGVEGEFDIKMENYCKVIKNLEGKMDSIDSEIKRLIERKKTFKNNIERMKSCMFDAMKSVGKREAGGDLFTARIQKNGGKLPVVLDVTDTCELPDELIRITESPDMEAIRELLDSGEKCKFAHYEERGESLRIR